MCGRFTNNLTWDEIVRLYRLRMKAPPHNLPPRYNICPTDPVDVVTERDGSRYFVRMRWGLVPSWWSKPLKDVKAATFNARAETVAEKPFFRDAFRRTRCLIPASGYFEWRHTATGKQPWYFTRADGEPMTFAGLWDEWKDKATGEVIRSIRQHFPYFNASGSRYLSTNKRGAPSPCWPNGFRSPPRRRSGRHARSR